MDWFIPIAVVLVVVLVIIVRWVLRARGDEAYPYVRNEALFTPAERSFLGALDRAVGPEYRVFGKVRVADVVSVRRMRDRSRWRQAFNRISPRHFDYVLCSKDDLGVVAVVELNDRSHRRRDRQDRDAFLVGLCDAIGLPLVQVPARKSYSVQALRAELLASIGVSERVGSSAAGTGDEAALR
jgi:hypothetical protein